jgi:DNA-binding NarL/FixJ family response regulator
VGEPGRVAPGVNRGWPPKPAHARNYRYWDGRTWIHESPTNGGARLAGDRAVVAEKLSRILAMADSVEVVAIATNAAHALEEALRHEPHVVAMDYHLPDVTASTESRTRTPATKIVVVIASDESDALDGSNVRHLDKSDDAEHLLDIVVNLSQADAAISPTKRRGLAPVGRHGRDHVEELTRRQTEILEIMADGLSDQAIADVLTLSLNTVRTHVQTILRKLGAHSKFEAVAVASRRQLLVR